MTQKLVDTGAPFLQETREIASFYVDLCLNEVSSEEDDPLKRSPATGLKSSSANKTAGASTVSGGPPPPSPRALVIAERLKFIGDNIDKKVKQELDQAFMKEFKLSSTIYLLGREQFSRICQTVLSTCSEKIHNGWEQAAVVFMGMFRMINALREQGEQEEATPTARSGQEGATPTVQGEQEGVNQREIMMQTMAGETLQAFGLDSWIDQHGGMRRFGDHVEGDGVCVPIEGTSVDV